MLSLWQSLPEHISPIAFVVGGFPIRFYSLCWIFGLLIVWYALSVFFRRDGTTESFRESLVGSLIWIFCGALIGGRLGYALLYAPESFWSNPLSIFFPFENGVFVGFFGMSFFGGVIGVMIALWCTSLRSSGTFFLRADYFALVAPLAIFFGRIGNFMNGELFGRVTTVPWGMYFPLGGGLLRHPSQLYEAFFEGIILFLILWRKRTMRTGPGMISISFLLWYGSIRFFMEFFREPDFAGEFFFGAFTRGQLYSVALLLVAVYLAHSVGRERSAILGG